MTNIDWYFDFISPFAYLQSRSLEHLQAYRPINYRPILLAGILGHWGQKGPAEIPGKRTFTYQYVQWFAQKHQVPFRCPPAHPFNPLRALRLALVCQCDPQAIGRIFRFLWEEGGDLTQDDAFQQLGKELGVDDALGAVGQQAIKDALIASTEAAVEQSVFGVPTLGIDGHLFFGNDATEMALDYLENPELMTSEEMQRVTNLPVGVSRI